MQLAVAHHRAAPKKSGEHFWPAPEPHLAPGVEVHMTVVPRDGRNVTPG